MNRTVRDGTSFQKIGALCAGVAHVLARGVALVLAASLANALVPHRALAAPGARVQKRTRILWTRVRISARSGWAIALVAAVTLVASRPVGAVPGPWQRTEVRTPCADSNVTRNAYFGDVHVHTTYSIDAVAFGTLNTPRDAYRFANGAAIGLAPYDGMGNPARTIQLGRPLDFTAVTDHAEGFGLQSVCFLPGLPGYDSLFCQQLRAASSSVDPASGQLALGTVAGEGTWGARPAPP